ncbi:MAG: PaaI family thioesterase [Peptococcaceae bacterium]|nr:PaaI family thioesterase [Peptococcaceae bacterium]
MDYKQLAIERFSNDLYATKTTGIIIEEVDVNCAKCSLSINENHLNAAGFVMGGAIFTLADFVFAIAANCENELTVSLSSQINYISATKGPILFAEAKCVKNAKNICFYDITVNDDKGNLVASVSTTGYRKA